jgi:predicted CXXCH cytochrome family protein
MRTARLATVGAIALIVALAVPGLAYAVTPTAPGLTDVYPSGGGQVTLKWLTSVDASHTLEYEIYRSQVPITQGMLTPTMKPLIEVVTPATGPTLSESTWTATVVALPAEIADSYVWFYAVRAKDSVGVYSPVSLSSPANVHGYRFAENTSTCATCHNVHGAPTPPGIVDRSSWICYYCHGRADDVTTGPGDRSTYNTKAEFYDYASQDAVGDAGSRHRSEKMETDKNECKACHSPHRAPYFYSSADGIAVAYDAAQSFRMFLRAQTGVSADKPTYTNGYYSQNSQAGVNTSFCFSCHGSTTASAGDGSAETNMLYVSDNGYNATAGDHNETGYSSAAHGTGVIYPNDYGTKSADYARIQCLACHEKHASRADKLIAYRGNDTRGTDSDYSQAELCYACHSTDADVTESKVAAGYTKPFSWNYNATSWNLGVEQAFGKKTPTSGSSHPTSAGGGTWVPVSATSFSQTTQAEFETDTRIQVSTTLVPGSVVLEQYNVTTPIPANPYVLSTQAANDTAAGGTRSYLAGDAAWNEDFNPTDVGTNPGAGANSTTKNGIVFAMQGGASNVYLTYTPPANSGTGTWGTTTNLWQPATTGSDMAFDSTDNYIWALVGGYTPVNNGNGTTNIRRTTNFAGTTLAWYSDGSTTGEDGPYFCTAANTPLRLGAGSSLAWVPANGTRPERLYTVNRDGTTTRNGQLYFFDNPDAASGGAIWTSTTTSSARRPRHLTPARAWPTSASARPTTSMRCAEEPTSSISCSWPTRRPPRGRGSTTARPTRGTSAPATAARFCGTATRHRPASACTPRAAATRAPRSRSPRGTAPRSYGATARRCSPTPRPARTSRRSRPTRPTRLSRRTAPPARSRPATSTLSRTR